jgi:hypothetical protein
MNEWIIFPFQVNFVTVADQCGAESSPHVSASVDSKHCRLYAIVLVPTATCSGHEYAQYADAVLQEMVGWNHLALPASALCNAPGKNQDGGCCCCIGSIAATVA